MIDKPPTYSDQDARLSVNESESRSPSAGTEGSDKLAPGPDLAAIGREYQAQCKSPCSSQDLMKNYRTNGITFSSIGAMRSWRT
jgi:hypothetical protein